jgi:oxygen-independent coproporphyrinogen-3 oxidase
MNVWPWARAEEFTLEANPKTLSSAKASLLKEWGVTRLSLGAQCFDSHLLKLLGRKHEPDDTARAVGVLRGVGFDNINIDLMFALPGQSRESWRETLNAALALGPEHISAYNLTYEEDTEFLEHLNSGAFSADEVQGRRHYDDAMDTFEKAGFVHYEISNFAQPGCECQHHLACWRGLDYLGLGPGACSTVGDRRWSNPPDTAGYTHSMIEHGTVQTEQEILSSAMRRVERIMLGLRTYEGIAPEWLEMRFAELRDLREEGLIETNAGRIRLTRGGKMAADSIAELLIFGK